MTYDYVFKGITVGNTNVGKSSFCQQFCNGTCPTEYDQTIGVDFFSRIVEIDPKHSIKLQLWDLSGSDDFKSVTRSYYRNAAIIFVIYDSTQRNSFNAVQNWIKEIRNTCSIDALLVLVHNKSDLLSHSQVNSTEAKLLAQTEHMLFFETSSRTGINVEDCVTTSVRELYNRISSGQIVPNGQSGVRALDVTSSQQLIEIVPNTPDNNRLCGGFCNIQ